MQLNLTTDYGIRCLLVLHLMGEDVSSKDISEKICIERDFTQKILRKLRDSGLVTSNKGKAGGYTLAKPLSEITLFEVMSVFEETMFMNRCLEPDHYCSRHGVEMGCEVHQFYLAFQDKLEHILKGNTLQDVLSHKYHLK